MDKKTRKLLKKLYKLPQPVPPKSLSEEMHTFSDRDDGWYEFGIYEDDPTLTNKEIHDILYSEIGRKYYNSQYDCTGQAFTGYIHFRRYNGLITVVHCVLIDC